MMGKHEEAASLLTKVISTARQQETAFLSAFLVNLGLVRLRQGMEKQAKDLCLEGLEKGRVSGDEDSVQQGEDCLEKVKDVLKPKE